MRCREAEDHGMQCARWIAGLVVVVAACGFPRPKQADAIDAPSKRRRPRRASAVLDLGRAQAGL